MAFSVKITGVPPQEDGSVWVIDNFPYPVHRLKEDPLFKETVDETMYMDYVTVLKPDDALAFHKKYKFELNLEHDQEEKIQRLESLLDKENWLGKICWVIIEIYEWETGLG